MDKQLLQMEKIFKKIENNCNYSQIKNRKESRLFALIKICRY
ncbi:hypothetical protein HJ01_02762 [Flavobacterium frigoris PS1]|uniref:Uncharacterized protein n=1 Tax=Flavobacterium frigoris (strain PS1) TaxID=1086011 RepID=H7FU42_FLAFP|nr:hypothetical protein HJ01_02762 [Flavobacterium frigoris PS1]